jgi:hypothetical protein
MSRPRWRTVVVAAALVILLSPSPGRAAPLRISSLVVTNTEGTLLVGAVLLGALPVELI